MAPLSLGMSTGSELMSSAAIVLSILGTRGSYPARVGSRSRYGVDTTCLSIPLSPSHIVVIDAGTGLIGLGESALARRGGIHYDMLFTHYHLDHLLGLPYFLPLYERSNSFRFYGHAFGGRTVENCLKGLITPPWFPVALEETASRKEFVTLSPGPLRLGDLTLRHAALRHPQGVTGYRIDSPQRSLLIATDHECGDEEADHRLYELGARVDYLLHDAQYTPEEYPAHRDWGHSTWEDAVRSARAMEAQNLLLFHHQPDRDDAQIDAIVLAAQRSFAATNAACDGMELRIS